FGWHLEEIHVTCAHLEKKRTRLRLYTIYLEELCKQSVETTLQTSSNGVRIFKVTARTIDQSTGGKLRDRNAEESWALLEDLALYENESWNDPRDFTKPVKAIYLPQDVPSTSNRRLIELENQTQRLMEVHLAPKKLVQVNKISSSCEICSEDPQCSTLIHSLINAITICPKRPGESQNNKPEEEEREGKDNPKNINTNPSSPPDPSVSLVIKKVHKLNSFFKSLDLVLESSDTKFVCTKGDDGDVMFIEIIKKYDDSRKEEAEVYENSKA
ncbi:hypothetical protein Tco_0231977, partial [Tanacetum coccineum]